mgnify:CR=1 FL=1
MPGADRRPAVSREVPNAAIAHRDRQGVGSGVTQCRFGQEGRGVTATWNWRRGPSAHRRNARQDRRSQEDHKEGMERPAVERRAAEEVQPQGIHMDNQYRFSRGNFQNKGSRGTHYKEHRGVIHRMRHRNNAQVRQWSHRLRLHRLQCHHRRGQRLAEERFNGRPQSRTMRTRPPAAAVARPSGYRC